MISIFVNGAVQQLDSGLSVAQLVLSMGLQNKRIAIERNGEIVPRSQFDQHTLSEGDRLEIVIAVGGG